MVTPRKRVTKAAQLHVESLKAAGLDYVPTRAALPPEPVALVTPAHIEPAPGESAAEFPPQALPTPPAAAAEVLIAANAPASLFDEAVAAEVPTTVEGRRHALQLLAKEVSTCPKCPALYSTRTQTVFGVGPLNPAICFIGEAPGAEEDRAGVPFVGRSGELLDKILAAMAVRRDEVAILNILKCRPPQNRTPAPDECANCRPYLEQQLELMQPQFICCFGNTAAQYLLGIKQGITKLRGKWYAYKGVPVICTFHPAALLRNPDWKKDTWEDMKVLLAKMGRPVPGARGK